MHLVMAEFDTCRKPRLSKFSLKQSTVDWSRLTQLKSPANFVQGRKRKSCVVFFLMSSSKLVAQ